MKRTAKRLIQNLLLIFVIVTISPSIIQAQKKQDVDSDFDKDVNLSNCVLPDFKLPLKAKIYAVGSRSGSKLSWQIDDSGREATLIKVAVNSPNEPVALILGAYEPTIWHLGWTEGSQIAAVVLSGHNTQKITGLPKSVPVLISTKENDAPCGEFYIESGKKTIPQKANTISKRLFGREIDNMFGVISGQAVVGEILPTESKLITNAELRREDFHPLNKPLFGEAGIQEALDKGLIRRATPEDAQEYLRLLAKKNELPDQITPKKIMDHLGLHDAYWVTSPGFIVPAGLRASDLKFIIPDNIALPNCQTGGCKFYSVAEAKSPRKERHSFECGIPDFKLPPNFKVYAASGNDAGVPINLKLYDNDKEAHLAEVVVNSPDEPVVLMLGAYKPTIWHFSWTKGTRIAAAVVSGSYPPIIIGLPDDVPVLKNYNNRQNKCPHINISSSINDLTSINDFANYLFKKDIDQTFNLESGKAFFGKPLPNDANLKTREQFSLEKFIKNDKPLTYKDVLAEAELQGLIRKAAKEDIQTYLKSLGKATGIPESIISEGIGLSDEASYYQFRESELYNSYVIVSSNFIIPENLYPQHFRMKYILPDGVPRPENVPDNASIYSVSEPVLPVNAKSEISNTCNFSDLKIPPKLKVYAGSGFLSSPVDFDFGGKRQHAELIPVTVNSPNEPVALILHGHNYQNTIWHFSWTEGTKIAAVVANGRVIGLPESVPVLETSACPGARVPTSIIAPGDIANLAALNNLSKHLFNKNIDRLYFDESNISSIGMPINSDVKRITNKQLKKEDYIDPDKPWGDQSSLTEDILKGSIRKATTRDMRQRLDDIAKKAGLPEHIVKNLNLYERGYSGHHGFIQYVPNPVPNTYIVLSPDFSIPATLYQREFEPIHAVHFTQDSASASFYYQDGSVIRCDFTPSKDKGSRGDASKLKPARASSPTNSNEQKELPKNLRLIYKQNPLDDDYEILTSDSISPLQTSLDSKALVWFHLPDGSRTFCSVQNYDDVIFEGQAHGAKRSGWGDSKENIQKRLQIPTSCGIPGFQVPPKLKVYAAGVRSGSKLNIPMGDRGRTAELVKLTVNSPKEPVALLLDAFEPTIWHLSWTRGTEIAAVVVSNDFHPQHITGLPAGVPVLYTGSGCPSFDVHLSNVGWGTMAIIGSALNVNNLANHLFKKDIDKMYEIYGGQIIIGRTPIGQDEKIETAEEFNAEKFTDPNKPLAGIHGINQAISKGLIRKAADDDYRKWQVRHYTILRNIPEDKVDEAIANDRRSSSYNTPPSPWNAYVVLSPDFIVPAGLNGYGSDSADFIIPEDIPLPQKQYENYSTFYLLKDGSCEGKDARPVCKANR